APTPAADAAPLAPAPPETPPPGRPRRRFVTVASFVLAGCVLLPALLLLLQPVRTLLFSSAAPPTPATPAGWKGFVDVVIYDQSDPNRQNVHLNDPNVAPLKPGDRFAVEAQLDRPAYCYVLWIDADGTVDPVYPWKPGHWDERPAEEQPV